MKSRAAFILRLSFFGLAMTAIIFAGAVSVCANIQQHERVVSEPEDAERLITVWLGAPPCHIAGVAGTIDEGWLAACNMSMTRRPPFGILVHISPDGSLLSTEMFRGRSLGLQSILKLHDGNFLLAGTDSPTYRDIQAAEFKQFDTFQHPETGEILQIRRNISSDFVAWKLAPGGETIWRQNYRRYDSDATADHYLSAALETPDGDLVFVGTTRSEDGTSGIRLLRTDREGEPLNETIYTPFENLTCGDAILTSDGEIIIGGTVNTIQHESARIILMKIDADGEMLWNRRYDKHGPGLLQSITKTTDGSVVIAGRSYDDDGNSTAFVKMLDEEGEELWTRHFDVAGFNHVIAAGDGGVFVTGMGLVVEIDGEGTILRQLRPEGLQIQQTVTVQIIDENRILLGGFAAPPEDEDVEYRRRQGFITIIRR